MISCREEKLHHLVVQPRVQTNAAQAISKRINKECVYTSNYLLFSGSSTDHEVYLTWDTNMKQWLCSNIIPNEEKLSYALSMLVGDANDWWVREDAETYHTKLVFSWTSLKIRMYLEFVKNHQTNNNSYPKPVYQATSKKVATTPKLQATTQGNCYVPSKFVELTCYMCKGQRHITKFCPTRKVTTKTEPAQQNLSRDLQANINNTTEHI